MKEKIKRIIFESIEVLNENSTDEILIQKDVDTPLFGESGKLDSLGLVDLLVTIEQTIEDEFDVSLIIADDRAMSQEHSPFRTVGTLADYIEVLLRENQ